MGERRRDVFFNCLTQVTSIGFTKRHHYCHVSVLKLDKTSNMVTKQKNCFVIASFDEHFN